MQMHPPTQDTNSNKHSLTRPFVVRSLPIVLSICSCIYYLLRVLPRDDRVLGCVALRDCIFGCDMVGVDPTPSCDVCVCVHARESLCVRVCALVRVSVHACEGV